MKKKWKHIVPIGILLIAIGSLGGFALFSSGDKNQVKIANEAILQKDQDEMKKDVPTDVVHEPTSKDIISFKSGEYSDGHEFIIDFHQFYNVTLCWGRVNTANYKEQKDKALEIIEALEGIEINNKDLYDDFIQIENLAKKVVENDNRKAMIALHRLFHDLDIHLNGYTRDDIFGVTAFKGI